MAEIYGLYSARDGIVRYVGQTGCDCGARFKQHKRDAWWTSLGKWFHHEWRHGYPVQCALLQSCEYGERHHVETEWISRFPNLLNERKLPYYRYDPKPKPPVIPEIRDYMRDHLFNVGGFRGVHWWRQIDRYAVFFYAGSEPEWLLGDEAPGWGGNIFFSDSTTALKARDRYREYQKYKYYKDWLPDIEQDAEW